ncbi:MAG: HEAT repeat domain-containing protein [Aphanothece sp. CMT-3BRIN-NPC111]|jgi:phycocyanobilin lyase alpha subunit|nr:HEAT repeat domain-containing protein [Aphanothece sp. CMT-3BRIN-NPC111]
MLDPSQKQDSESVSLPTEPFGGGHLTLEQAIANLTHADLSLRYYAAWWLGKFATGEPKVVDGLIAALDDESDRTELGGYPLRRNAARALGKLADSRAVPPLIRCLECDDFYVREAAAQSLGMLGDRTCIPQLMQLLAGGVAETQLVPGRPHLAQPAEAVMEALQALKATEAVPLIQPFLEHPVERIRYGAARAMYALTQESVYGERLVQAIANRDLSLQLRRTLLLDLGASGYLPGAQAIAHATVENSFKMIALKSLLENHLQQLETVSLSTEAQQVMTLMDALL